MGDLRAVQVAPPSELPTIVPPLPTAGQTVAPAQLTPSSERPVGEVDVDQVAPSLVVTIAPRSPTATQWLSSAHDTERRSFPCGRGYCQVVEPSGAGSSLPGAGPADGAAAPPAVAV